MPERNPLLGVSLSLVGCCCSAAGYVLQKLAHARVNALNAAAAEAARNAGAQPPPALAYWRCWQWIAGLGALVVGSVFAGLWPTQ